MLRPRASVVPSSERASTRLSWPQPLVMNRFTPLRRQVPSPAWVALSCTFCRSLPASGSVSAMLAVTSPLANLGRYAAFISSSANLLTVSAMSCSPKMFMSCLLYTSDAADDLLCVDLGGRRIIKKKKDKIPLHYLAL